MENCPICYESITDINICVTVCKHKFHTNCLMKCGNVCPICRTNIISNTSSSSVPPGRYTLSEYIQQLNQNNISIDDLSLREKLWIDECKEHDEIIKKIEEKNRQKEERHKNALKKTDINKYNLFYGK